MLLFPGDIQSLIANLTDRLDIDAGLMEVCQPLIEQEAYADLILATVGVLKRRLAAKTGLSPDELMTAPWGERVNWEMAGFAPETAQPLMSLCQGVLAGLGPNQLDSHVTCFPVTAKTSRAALLLIDLLLAELNRLPDQVTVAELPADFDARPFFEELSTSLNALLPYEQRNFPTQVSPTRLKFLLPDLPDKTYYAVTIRPPVGDEAGRLEIGLHFEGGDLDKLGRYFQRKLPGLSRSMGDKEIALEEGDGRLAVLLFLPYQPSAKLSAFLLAATLVGFISSTQERMPR